MKLINKIRSKTYEPRNDRSEKLSKNNDLRQMVIHIISMDNFLLAWVRSGKRDKVHHELRFTSCTPRLDPHEHYLSL